MEACVGTWSSSSSSASPLTFCRIKYGHSHSHSHAAIHLCRNKNKNKKEAGLGAGVQSPLVPRSPEPWNRFRSIRIPAVDRESPPRTSPDGSQSQEGKEEEEEEPGQTIVAEDAEEVRNPAKLDGGIGTTAAAASFRELKNPPPLPPQPVSGFLQGVIDETRAVDWPAFPKVLSITGVVVGIILGSSLVLLTVNALLAELAAQVFSNDGTNTYLKNLF